MPDTDNTPLDPSQDPIAELLAGYHAKTAPFLAAHQGELAALRDNPPVTVDDKFACGLGRMAPDKDKPGDGIQLPDTVEHRAWTLREMYQWVKAESRICAKFDSPCFYTAVPAVPGSSKKTNFHHSSLVALDLDGTIKDSAGLARLRRWCALYACLLYSSARHDPERGVYRLRIVLLLNASLSYEEHRRVAKSICTLLASYLGTTEGIDTCTERAFQPMLLPGWRDAVIAAQAIAELFIGEAMDVVVPLAEARQEIEAAAAHTRGRGTAAATMRASSPRMVVAAGAGDIDREARAVAELPSVPAGAGQSDRGLWGAAVILRDWEVCEDQAVEIMLSQYGGEHEEARIRHKVRDAYGGNHPSRGWRYRAAMADRPITLDEVGELELDGAKLAYGARSSGLDGDCDVLPSKTRRLAGDTQPEESLNSPRVECHQRVMGKSPKAPTRQGTTRRYIEARYLPAPSSFCEFRAKITGIKSRCGTGKNYSLRAAIRQAVQDPRQRVITVGHRISLAETQSSVWAPLASYRSQIGELTDSHSVCLDSIARVQACPSLDLEDEVDLTIVIDEARQVMQHMFAGTILGKGILGGVWSGLRALMRQAKHIILQDADLDSFTLFAAYVLLGWDKDPSQISTEIIINTWRPEPRPVFIYLRIPEQYLVDLVAACGEGPVFEFCTSRRTAQKHESLLRAAYPDKRIVLICRDTTATDDTLAVLADPSEYERIDILIVTTSYGSGVSIDVPNRFGVWGHCCSGDGPDAYTCKQGLERPRTPREDWRVFIGGAAVVGDTNPERVLARAFQKSETSYQLLKGQQWTQARRPDGEIELSLDNTDTLRVHAEVLADSVRYGNLGPREIQDEAGNVIEVKPGALIAHFEEIGLVPQYVDDTLDEAQRKAAKKMLELSAACIDEKKAILLLNAIRRTYEEAKEMAIRGETGTPEKRAEVDRAVMEHFYAAELDRDLIARDDDGARRGQLVSLADLLAHQRGEEDAVALQDHFDFRAGLASQVDHRALKATFKKALWEAAGIHDIEKDAANGTVLRDPGPIGAFTKARDDVKTFTGLGVSDKEAEDRMRWYRKLAAQDGFRLSPPERYRDEMGQIRRRYRIERESAAQAVADAKAQYERLLTPPPKRGPPDAVQQKLNELLALLDQPEGEVP